MIIGILDFALTFNKEENYKKMFLSEYSYDKENNKKINPEDAMNNFINDVESFSKTEIVIVQAEEFIVKEIKNRGLEMILISPSNNLEEEYKERYKNSRAKFINEDWDK